MENIKENLNETIEQTNEIAAYQAQELKAVTPTEKQTYCNLDLSNQENQDKLFNALDSADICINDIVGQTINLAGYYITKSHYTDKETGELLSSCRIILFGDDGTTYYSGSHALASRIQRMVEIYGEPSFVKPFKIQFTKVKLRANAQGESLSFKKI